MKFDITLLFWTPLLLAIWFGLLFAISLILSEKELGRFGQKLTVAEILGQWWRRFLSSLGRSPADSPTQQAEREIEREIERRLREAGLESAFERGGFMLFRVLSSLSGPFLGGVSYLFLSTYYATVFTIIVVFVGVLVPHLWLRQRSLKRDEDIQRELPLLIDLANLGVSAGWDISVALENSIDSLAEKFPQHPLMREFKVARLLSASGYTWYEALERVGKRLKNDAVRRCTLALSQALRQGGDRSLQLDGIASDAQRIYYAQLDSRLAALPVKAVIIAMVLLLSYLMIILAPTVVQIKNTVFTVKSWQ